MTDPTPTVKGVHERAGNGERKLWASQHDLTCWRSHPACALNRARDLELARREHAAARARLFGEAAARAVRIDPLDQLCQLGDVIAAARAVLEAQHATVDGRARSRGARRQVG